MKFDHIGLSETSRHWPSLQDEDKTPQRLRGHFMSHQLYTTTAFDEHEPFLGSFQYGGTDSLSTKNLIGSKTSSGRDP